MRPTSRSAGSATRAPEDGSAARRPTSRRSRTRSGWRWEGACRSTRC